MFNGNKKPRLYLYDLISSQGCRRAFLWGRQWSPIQPNPHLWLGRGVHQGLESYYRHDRSVEAALTSYEFFVSKSFREFSLQFPVGYNQIVEPLREWIPLGRSMIENYSAYEEVYPLEGEPQAIEQTVRVDFGNFVISGRIDLIMKGARGFYVVDHKTAGSLQEKDLSFDLQLLAYAWMASKVLKEAPSKVVHNILVKSELESPTLIRNGSALSKAKSQTTTPLLYREAIQTHGFKEEDYEDYLQFLEGHWHESLFHRDVSHVTQSALDEFEETVRARGEYALRLLNGETPAFPVLDPWTCTWCQFRSPCQVQNQGGDAEFVLESRFTKS